MLKIRRPAPQAQAGGGQWWPTTWKDVGRDFSPRLDLPKVMISWRKERLFTACLGHTSETRTGGTTSASLHNPVNSCGKSKLARCVKLVVLLYIRA